MHEDGTEHEWLIVLVLEQGEYLPAGAFCRRCGLSSLDLIDDWPLVDLENLLEG